MQCLAVLGTAYQVPCHPRHCSQNVYCCCIRGSGTQSYTLCLLKHTLLHCKDGIHIKRYRAGGSHINLAAGRGAIVVAFVAISSCIRQHITHESSHEFDAHREASSSAASESSPILGNSSPFLFKTTAGKVRSPVRFLRTSPSA